MTVPMDPSATWAACEAAARLDCGQCTALAGNECVYTTNPAGPVRGYHAGRLARAGIEVPGVLPAAIVWDNADAPRPASPGPAHGPYETERQVRELPAVRAVYDAFGADPGPGKMAPRCRCIVDVACSAAGVEIGAYDDRILAWLAGWGPETCAVVAGLITRAHEAGAAARGMTEAGGR